MPFIPYYGNILDKETDVIVAPCVEGSAYIFPITAKIYEAADYYEISYQLIMLDETPPKECIDYGMYYNIGIDDASRKENDRQRLLHPSVYVTKGFGLKQKAIVHLFISGEFTNFNEPDCRAYITYCYYDVLTMALKAGLKSVVFPLLESCVLGLPVKEAWENAKKAVNHWLSVKEKKLGHPVDIDIFIVSDTIENGEKIDSFSDYSCFAEYEKKFQKKLSEAENQYELKVALVNEYISRMEDVRLAEIINWDSGSINKIKNNKSKSNKTKSNKTKSNKTNSKNKKLHSAHKHRIIAMAVGLKLDDYERYEFINCLVREYPKDFQDFCVEKILRSGITDFDEVNMLLYGISPKLVLDAPVKKPSSQSQSKNKDREK